MTKNKIKKLSIVALTGLVAVGAYAFIKDSRVQSGTNLIKPGVISITFDNEVDAISLSGNTAVPMTNNYAKQNQTPYKFDIVNDGDISLDYAIYAENITGTFDPFLIKLTSNTMYSEDDDEMFNVGIDLGQVEYTDEYEPMRSIAEGYDLLPGESVSYEIVAYVDGEFTTLDQYDGKDISFNLVAKAIQTPEDKDGLYIGEVHDSGKLFIFVYNPPLIYDSTWNEMRADYELIEQKVTSFKVNGIELFNYYGNRNGYGTSSSFDRTTRQAYGYIYNNAIKLQEGENDIVLVYDGNTYNFTFNYTKTYQQPNIKILPN